MLNWDNIVKCNKLCTYLNSDRCITVEFFYFKWRQKFKTLQRNTRKVLSIYVLKTGFGILMENLYTEDEAKYAWR